MDWSTPGLVPMEADVWSTRVTRDAFDRPVTMHAPDGSLVRPAYNERGLVRAVSVELASPPAGAIPPGVESVTYDAKGQRQVVRYANGVETTYVYEKTTLRLLSLVAKRASGITLQRLLYTYDPVGNVTTLRDQAQAKLYLTDDLVSADASYVYDAAYQLRRATGREHEGQMAAPDPRDTGRTGLAHPGDRTKMRNYTQSYSYDEVGNMLALVHEAKDGDYTRTFHHERTSRVEGSRHGNALTETRVVTSNANNTVASPYTHDEHGNVVTMPHLPLMVWNHRDQLWKVSGQVVAAGDTPETTYYLYDAAGERVRKVTCAQGTTTKVEERLYLGGFEVLRKSTNAGPREETTLHVMVDSARVALIERESGTTLVRYQLDNHIDSVCVEVDGTTDANIVSYEEYHPFGTTSFQSQNTRASKRYRFTSKERDRETGFAYHSSRYYTPWLARWLSPDPAGLVDGANRWVYTRNNPTNLTDSTGMAPDPNLQGATQPPPTPIPVENFEPTACFELDSAWFKAEMARRYCAGCSDGRATQMSGALFESIVAVSINEAPNERMWDSAYRKAMTGGMKLRVKPDFVGTLHAFEPPRPWQLPIPVLVGTYVDSIFADAKMSTDLTPSYDGHQLSGMIDVVSKSEAGGWNSRVPPAFALFTSGDAYVSTKLVAFATERNVLLLQSRMEVCVDAKPLTQEAYRVGPVKALNEAPPRALPSIVRALGMLIGLYKKDGVSRQSSYGRVEPWFNHRFVQLPNSSMPPPPVASPAHP